MAEIGDPLKPGDLGPPCLFLGDEESTVPCQSPVAQNPWYNPKSCYLSKADDPVSAPPDDSGRWFYYLCWGDGLVGPPFAQFIPTINVWLPFDAHAAPPAPPPAPEELAEEAIESMNLSPIEIGMNPPPSVNPASVLVNAPTHLYVANPGETTTGPATGSASAGGITVTATGSVERIEWDMGDGVVVTCAGDALLGRAWSEDMGWDEPLCGHHYERTADSYTVTATSFWHIEWSVDGGGATGTEDLDYSASVQVGVRDAPAHLVPGPSDG